MGAQKREGFWGQKIMRSTDTWWLRITQLSSDSKTSFHCIMLHFIDRCCEPRRLEISCREITNSWGDQVGTVTPNKDNVQGLEKSVEANRNILCPETIDMKCGMQGGWVRENQWRSKQRFQSEIQKVWDSLGHDLVKGPKAEAFIGMCASGLSDIYCALQTTLPISNSETQPQARSYDLFFIWPLFSLSLFFH